MTQKIEGGLRLKGTRSEPPPLVSIITVVFHARLDLPDLLESVTANTNDQVEFIVVDGGSLDGTCELLREYDSKIDYWLSEPDQGIYDAMNKGISLARGTFIYHLNAGDRLLHLPIRELEAADSRGVDIVAFRVSLDGRHQFRPTGGFLLRLKNTLHHQGTFFRRAALPPYNIRYRIFADFDLNQRLHLRGAKVELLDQIVALHSSGGASDTPSKSANSEFFQVIRGNYGPFYLPLAWLLCKWRGFVSRWNHCLAAKFFSRQMKQPPQAI